MHASALRNPSQRPQGLLGWTDSTQPIQRNPTLARKSKSAKAWSPLARGAMSRNDMADTCGRPDSEEAGGWFVNREAVHESQEHQDHEHNYLRRQNYLRDSHQARNGLKQRLKYFTFAWYALPMSIGGLSLLIFAQPHQFPRLRSIGPAIYLVNIVIFMVVTLTMAVRFLLYPSDMCASIQQPRQGFFVPTLLLAIAMLITSTSRYAMPESVGLGWAVHGGFWIHVVATLLLAVGQYSIVFAAHSFGLNTKVPTWVLPIFPVMLSGAIACVTAAAQPATFGMPTIAAGVACQGLGFSVAVIIYAHIIEPSYGNQFAKARAMPGIVHVCRAACLHRAGRSQDGERAA